MFQNDTRNLPLLQVTFLTLVLLARDPTWHQGSSRPSGTQLYSELVQHARLMLNRTTLFKYSFFWSSSLPFFLWLYRSLTQSLCYHCMVDCRLDCRFPTSAHWARFQTGKRRFTNSSTVIFQFIFHLKLAVDSMKESVSKMLPANSCPHHSRGNLILIDGQLTRSGRIMPGCKNTRFDLQVPSTPPHPTSCISPVTTSSVILAACSRSSLMRNGMKARVKFNKLAVDNQVLFDNAPDRLQSVCREDGHNTTHNAASWRDS